MKGFLIFLAVAFPVVLASPFFWSLVRMEWGAERVGYVYQDGVRQWATLGPKAPWPKWAVVPSGARLTVKASYEPAPGHPAIGYGEIDGKVGPRDTVRRYQDALAAAGWAVRVGRFDATYPEIPPRPLHWCIVQAERGGQVQQMSVDIDETQTVGRLRWTDGKMSFPTGARDEACWS
ncbi:MAG TPA: hypothetical protein VH392_03200 [Sphingomicrobium sp.]